MHSALTAIRAFAVAASAGSVKARQSALPIAHIYHGFYFYLKTAGYEYMTKRAGLYLHCALRTIRAFVRAAPAISAETQSITLPIGDICSWALSKLESSFSVIGKVCIFLP